MTGATSSATGGTGSTTGGTDSTASGSDGGSGGAGFFEDDFESGQPGKQPDGWNNFISYQANGPNPNGQTLALVDETRAHSGKRSVHIHGGQNPAQITRALPAGTNKLYVREYVYMTRQIGADTDPQENHETVIALRGNPTTGVDNEVRFGQIKGVLGTNITPSDNISPKQDQWGKGPIVPANTWTCIEVAFIGDLPQNELHAWVNGTLVHEITSPDQWNNQSPTDPAESPDWLSGKFVQVVLGWQSFSGFDIDMWIDDVVLSTSPIGCN